MAQNVLQEQNLLVLFLTDGLCLGCFIEGFFKVFIFLVASWKKEKTTLSIGQVDEQKTNIVVRNEWCIAKRKEPNQVPVD